MPLVTSNSDLLDRIKVNDKTALSTKEASKHSSRELHVGIINMMGSLKATELQFLLPIGRISGHQQIIPHFIKVDGIDYGENAEYVEENYITLDEAKEIGLDAMIATGANSKSVESPNQDDNDHAFSTEAGFYKALESIIEYAESDEGPTSTLYSCLAFHAYMQIKHGEIRNKLEDKIIGNFDHWVTSVEHPLTEGTSSHFKMPHGRWNDIEWQQVVDADMKLLAHSDEAGVLLATTNDGLRGVFLQGHPEYSGGTIYREWRRDFSEMALERVKNPNKDIKTVPLPKHYLEGKGLELATEFYNKVEAGELDEQIRKDGMLNVPDHLSQNIMDRTPNVHSSVANDIIGNWVTAVFKVTDREYGKPFMDGIDKDNIFDLPEEQPIYSSVHFDTSDPA